MVPHRARRRALRSLGNFPATALEGGSLTHNPTPPADPARFIAVHRLIKGNQARWYEPLGFFPIFRAQRPDPLAFPAKPLPLGQRYRTPEIVGAAITL